MPEQFRVINVEKNIFAAEEAVAEETRRRLEASRTLFVNLMASPGAGKTTLLKGTIEALREQYRVGVLEADIDDTIDTVAMTKAGVPALQVHTGGECAMDASMTKRALDAFGAEDYDLIFLENVGNLVCPAENDVGANLRAAILSVPEGDDKPLKYPLMFTVADVVLINKIDTTDYFAFDFDEVKKRILLRNPHAEIFFVSARTGEGMDAWVRYLHDRLARMNA